eukprot:scaffold4723_cov172-Amphora_coffeaeformis.AAC.13
MDPSGPRRTSPFRNLDFSHSLSMYRTKVQGSSSKPPAFPLTSTQKVVNINNNIKHLSALFSKSLNEKDLSPFEISGSSIQDEEWNRIPLSGTTSTTNSMQTIQVQQLPHLIAQTFPFASFSQVPSAKDTMPTSFPQDGGLLDEPGDEFSAHVPDFLPASSTFREQDIVLGRGAQYANNPGNRRFYQAIDNGIPHYDAAKSKHEKSNVVLSIFRSLTTENRRFVGKNDEDGSYEQLVLKALFSTIDKDARQKISHAVRYRKQHKSEQSLRSAAIQRANECELEESSSNSTFSRGGRRARSSSTPALELNVLKQEEEIDDVSSDEVKETFSLFSDEELESVIPNGNELPSCAASFEFYSLQDEFRQARGKEEEDDDHHNFKQPW